MIYEQREYYGRCSCSCGCQKEWGPTADPSDKDDVCDDCLIDCRQVGPRTLMIRKERER